MIRVRITGLQEANATILAAVRNGVDSALAVAAARGQSIVQGNITSPFLGRPPAVSTGALANSISFSVSREAGISRAVVFSQPPAGDYAAYVESGTGPHFPPPSALLLWVKRKFHIEDEKQALSIAFAIARTIARRGVSGFGMFARAFQALQAELPGIFQREIGKSLEAAGAGK